MQSKNTTPPFFYFVFYAILFNIFALGSTAYGQLQYEWANRLDDANIASTDSISIQDIATDPSGNILITGSFRSSLIDFDLGPGVQNLTYSGNSAWIFVVKYDPNGNYVWGHSFGGTSGAHIGYGITTDGAGNVIVTGSFNGEVDFDPGPSSDTLSSFQSGLPSGYDPDVFLAKYDPSGNHLWALSFGGKSVDCACCNNCGPDIGYDVEVASNGYIAVVGQFTRTTDFDPSAATANLTTAGYVDAFTAVYDANGNYVWAKQYGGGDFDRGVRVAISGNWVHMLYKTVSPVFPSGVVEQTIVTRESVIGGVSAVWIFPSGGMAGSSNDPQDIIVDNNGDIYITGYYQGDMTFTSSLSSSGMNDAIFLAKFNGANGSEIWAEGYTGMDGVRGTSLAFDKKNDLVLAGTLTSSLSLDGITISSHHTNRSDLFLATYSTTADTFIWADVIKPTTSGFSGFIPHLITSDNNGNIISALNQKANAGDNIDFDLSTTGVATQSLADERDWFIAKYSSCPPSTIEIIDGDNHLCNHDDSVRILPRVPDYNCLHCIVDFYDANNNLIISQEVNDTLSIYQKGTYYTKLQGCPTVDTFFQIQQDIVNPAISILPNDTTICAGDSVTLIATDSCVGCQYIWQQVYPNINTIAFNKLPIHITLQADSVQYLIGAVYNSGLPTECANSDTIHLYRINNRIAGMNLASPMQPSDPAQNLDLGMSFSPSPPVPAGSFSGPGVSGSNFNPAASGGGTHYISYSYTESGCTFTATDTIVVIDTTSSSATFSNLNPNASPYQNSEACIGDSMTFTFFVPAGGQPNQYDSLLVSDGQGGTIASYIYYGNNVPSPGGYNRTIKAIIPSGAKTGPIATRKSTGVPSPINLGNLIVNNPDVSFIIGKNPICSNDTISLTGVPAGGVFSATYQPSATPATGVIVGNELHAPQISSYTNGTRAINIRYTYTASYGGGAGNVCAQSIVDSNKVTAHNIQLDSVQFFPIANSETNVPIDSIIRVVSPDTARSYIEDFMGQGIGGTTGNYSFYPNLLAVGTYPISYQVSNSVGCVNLVTGNIDIIAPPALTGLSGSQYCTTAGAENIVRDPAYPFSTSTTVNANTGNSITRETNLMETTIIGGTYNMTNPIDFGPYDTQPNRYYRFNPPQAAPGQLIFKTTYRYAKTVYSGTPPYSVIERESHIIGSTIDTILIGSGQPVQILDTASVYCEEDAYYKIRLTPNTGTFTIEKIGGGFSTSFVPNAAGEVFINPYQIHQTETTDTDYRMIYSFGAVGCADADTVVFTIPEPADASFATDKYPNLPALPSYCKNELPDTLRPTVQGGLFTINGFPSNTQTFKPAGLTANQNHTVIYSIPNSYGCLSQLSDTFRVNRLPAISFDTLLDNSYCVYAGNIPINGIPSGGTFTLYTRNNTQNMGNSFALDPTTIPGIDTLADTIRVEYSYTDANGCTNLKQTTTVIHPRPDVFMPNLADRYCVDPSSSISLSPTPSGGSFFFINQASTNFNTTTGTYRPSVVTAAKDIIAYMYQSPVTACRDTLIDSTEVIGAGTTPMVTQKLDSTGNGVCFLGDTLELRVSPTPSLPDTASFASSAATPNGGIIFSSTATGVARFVPSQAAEGNIIVTYTYYDQSAGCSASASDTVVVYPLPKLTMNIGANLDSVCQFTSAQSLAAYDNGTPLAMSSVNFWGDGVYNNQFYPDSVAGGKNFIQLSYVNSYNCTDTIRDSIKVLLNPYPTIRGLNNIYCNSASPDTIFGTPTGGAWSPSGTIYLETPAGVSYAIFKPQLAPIGINTINYTVTNPSGCQNTLSQNTEVTGQPTLGFSQPTQIQFCNNDTLHKVKATVNGTVIPYDLVKFSIREIASGNIVSAGIVKDSFFDPSAQTGALQLIIEYSDPNSGCVAIDSTQIFVTEAPIAAFTGLNSSRTYCIDNPPVNLDGSNTIASGGINPSQTYYTITGNPNAILNTSLRNATYYPDSMGGGTDTIVFTVTDMGGCMDTAMAAVTVRTLPSGLDISGLDTAVCTNQQEIEVLGFPQASLNTFYLYNHQDSLLDVDTTNEFFLQPSQFGIGNYKLVFQFTDNFSCVNTDTNHFRIHPSPKANYQQLNFCYGDTIRILDQSSLDTSLTASDSLKFWSWEYNGLAYGINTDPSLQLANQPVGWGNAKLVVFTGTGCTDTITSQSLINGRIGDTIFVYTVPTTSFTTLGGCQGVAVDFKPDSSNLQPIFNQVSFDQLTNVQWIFGDGDSSTINAQNATTIGNFQHIYSQAGIYYPILNATNKNLCKSSDTFRLVVSPKVSNYPYAEDFESGTGGWLQSESSADSLWQWGIATGSDINTLANSDHIWATNLAGTYPSDSTAVWVYSPCFDLRYLQRPMFKMNKRSDMLLVDGASIDYFDSVAEEWKTLGRKDKGINWYNVNSVFGLIGQKQAEGTLTTGSLNGWSGVENSWKDARYRLDELKGLDNVRFRINFGALKSATNNNFDGFAFDDVWIGERTRNTLVEYFSNYNYINNQTGESILDANQVVYNAIFNSYNGKDVYLLEYHLDAPNNDPINAHNPAEHNAREIQYGALSPATVVVDGNEYKGSYKNLSQNVFDYSMLQDPAFNIDIQSLTIIGNNATVKTTVEAKKDITTSAKYIVHLAIMEDTIELAGDTMYNVLRKFLPLHEGNTYTRTWLKGDTIQLQETWSGFSFNTYDSSRLEAIVFIQNEGTSEVYQVATTRNLNFSNPCNNCAIGVEQTESNTPEIFDINLYPNPAQDYFSVEFPKALTHDYEWKLWDIRGVELQRGQMYEGESIQTVSTSSLPAGAYIFAIYDEQHNTYVQRKVIILKP